MAEQYNLQTLIGITGPATAGKDTAAACLVHNFGFKRYALADNLKAAACYIFGVTDFDIQNRKETKVPFWDKSPRELLQLMGTQAMRETFGPDIWVKSLTKNIIDTHPQKVVVTDIRFDNEAEWIKKTGGVIWKIERDAAAKVAAHVSEDGIDDKLVDVVFNNNDTIEALYEQLIREYMANLIENLANK